MEMLERRKNTSWKETKSWKTSWKVLGGRMASLRDDPYEAIGFSCAWKAEGQSHA